MKLLRSTFFGFLAYLCAVSASWAESEPVIHYDWGPFASSWKDVYGNERTRFLGPVGETIRSPKDDTLVAVRPFYHSWYEDDADFRRTEMLWPIWVYRQRENSSYWRFLLNFYWNRDVTDSTSQWRLWVLPFYFQGRDVKGENYVALFPIAGSIHELFFWDKIDFALFPLFVKSKMRDIEATTFLWPFFSKTRGDNVKRFRIFPFYGYSEHKGIGRKTTVLWPFWTQVKYVLPESAGKGWILFPITGHLKLTNQETWWILPPIFRYSIGEDQNRLFGPWPFFQKEEGEVNKLYIFPLYGRKRHAGIDRTFFLWPLGQYETTTRDTGKKTKFHFIPFVQHFREEPSDVMDEESEGKMSYTKIWPIYSHFTKEDGDWKRTAFFDFNPMRGGPVERSYSPFWQIYVRSQLKDQIDVEVLWGLYRSAKRGEDYRYRSLFPFFNYTKDTEEDVRHFQLFKGLLGRKRVGENKQWQLLYLFHFGDKEVDL